MTAAAPPRSNLPARAPKLLGGPIATLIAARGWRRRAIAAGAGVLAALAFAPFYLLPLMLVAYTALVFLIDGAATEKTPLRSAFGVGWFFGFGFHLVGLYWMAFSFFVQAEEFAWMAPFAMLGMPAFLSLFTGAAAALAARFWRAGWRRVVVFAVAFMILEYARGHILTGLPWNLPGQALAGTAAGAQSTALYGVYGLSFVALLIAAAPAAVKGRVLEGAGVSALAAALLFGFGALRLAGPGPGVHDDVLVRIVQPNIPQREKIDGNLWTRNFLKHVELSKGAAPEGARMFILWPENAAAFLSEYEDALVHLSAELPARSVLLTGSVRREKDAVDRERYYNALAVIAATPQGRRVAIDHYDKHHLVPFGEYLPFYGVLKAVGLNELTPYGDDGFSAGVGPRTLNAGGPSFAPLICYEAIFPGALHPRNERPEWLVAVTNDAWFGDTSGPRQHLGQARLRAIESGLPMARSANTGISALIDSRGRYVGRVPLYETGVIDSPLPRAAPPTLYARAGDSIFAFLMIAALAIAGVGRNRARAGA